MKNEIEHYNKPAALLAEPLLLALDGDDGGFRVHFADSVAAVIVSAIPEIVIAFIHRTLHHLLCLVIHAGSL